jgi:hypothetical protein
MTLGEGLNFYGFLTLVYNRSWSSFWMMSQPVSVWGMTQREQSFMPEGRTENSPGQESKNKGQ